MTTRIHCDAPGGCDAYFDEDTAIVGDWRRVEYISDTYSISTDTVAKHFCSLACLTRWAGEGAMRQLREREPSRA